MSSVPPSGRPLPEQYDTVAALRAALLPLRSRGPVALVPTMGALHEGHAALIREARRMAGPAGTVVVSLFVNPAQFGPGEDLERYPRTLESDSALCAREGADLLFTPSPAEIYRPDHSVRVEETALSRGLCGRSRPGHFPGVCLVVSKLLWIVQPGLAVFGKKDYQQFAVLRRLVRDLDIPVRIVGVPTVREPDGLALSSRNRFLSPGERAVAPRIHRALQAAHARWQGDPAQKAESLRNAVAADLEELPGLRLDYAELVDAETLEPCRGPLDRPAVLAVAAFLGSTRLIDNLEFSP